MRMLRLAGAQTMRRWARSLAVVMAIVVASVSFALLSSAVASSKLEVHGTINANYQSAYDILVRPKASATALEKSNGLVQENYLGGLYGGITMKQLRQVKNTQGVEVAAPIAMIGYTLPAIQLPVRLDKDIGPATDQVLAMRPTWTTDRGLSTFADATQYLYYTRRHTQWFKDQTTGDTLRDPVTGKLVAPCQSLLDNTLPPRSAFDLRRLGGMVCQGSNPPQPGRFLFKFPRGASGLSFYYQIPMLIAAIDPVAEARLVGLDDAVVKGRYLTESDKTAAVPVDNRKLAAKQLKVPVLMADHPLTDDSVTLQVQRLDVSNPDSLPHDLSRPNAPSWLAKQSGTTVQTLTFDDQQVYKQVLHLYRTNQSNTHFQYWRGGLSSYTTGTGGNLTPTPIAPLAPETYVSKYFGQFFAPQPSRDQAFRPLHQHEASTSFTSNNVLLDPSLKTVGTYDPSKILGFSKLSKVPLTTYYPPDAAPADAAASKALGAKSLLPNANLTGYLQQPPTILTTIKSLPTFLGNKSFPDVTAAEQKAPISTVRIRVAGVTGANAESRERVRLVAEKIARETGLTVDITAGTSPTPQTIDLPAGKFGRPDLQISEGWVKKNVSVLLLNSIDRKSLALFVLVLIVCLLFLSNATVAAVRTRRSELGVLACVGWSASRIFVLLQAELLVTGFVAGLLGTGIAAVLVAGFGLHVAWWHLLLITPVATLLASLAGVWPAWRASHTTPVEAINPAVSAPRRARNVNSIGKLAWVGVRRLPGRTILGAASLFVGVAALAVLVAVQQAFQGQVTGTALGDYIAVQVRGVDYLAAAITIGLGAFAVADICYLNIAERTAEIGTLRSTGWTDNHLRRLFATEAFITATLGALAGAVLGVVAAAVILPIGFGTVVESAALAAAAGIVLSMLAVTAPLTRLRSLAPASAMA